jgi:16S rRNA (uracil1498-N3)-methyltransferase
MRPAADAAPSFVFVPGLRSLPERFTLEGDEAHYLARVVRAREGERLHASDGAGLVATLRVERARPDPVLLVEARRDVERPAEARLFCGAPEHGRADWLVEKLAELGLTEFQPVDTERARWPDDAREPRWERLAVAALRQSRSAWRMVVRPAIALAQAAGGLGGGARWLADPEGTPPADLPIHANGPVVGAVGPSAGFSEQERNTLLSLGFEPVRLAVARLRTETAAVALAAHWAARRAPAGP